MCVFFLLLLFFHLPIIYLSLALSFFNFIFHLLTIYLILIITLLLYYLCHSYHCYYYYNYYYYSYFWEIKWGRVPSKEFKWWISRFRGVYRDLIASRGSSFWYYLKVFGHSVMSQGAPLLVVVGVLYLPLHFIIIVIITITFIVNIIFIIFIMIRIFITSSLLYLWGRLTVWCCFFQFLHLS